MPESEGIRAKNSLSAPMPPADAPRPTTRKSLVLCTLPVPLVALLRFTYTASLPLFPIRGLWLRVYTRMPYKETEIKGVGQSKQTNADRESKNGKMADKAT